VSEFTEMLDVFFNRRPARNDEPYEFQALANYNAEVARGLVHTDEYKTRMALEQRRFNKKHYGTETPKPGGVYFADDRGEKR
jgi:hypothetical protein